MSIETEVTAEVSAMMERIPEYASIASVEQANDVVIQLKVIRNARKYLCEKLDPLIAQANGLHKSLCGFKAQADKIPAEKEAQYRALLMDYQQREEAERREAQRQLDAQAAQAAAAQARVEGDERIAKAIEAGKVAVASTQVAPKADKLQGVTTRESWEAEIVDRGALIRACLKGAAPISWIQFDMRAINQVVRSSKGGITIPGIVCRKALGITAR